MKRHALCITAMLLMTFVLTGCPWARRITAEFTSANVSGSARDSWLAGSGALEDDAATNDAAITPRELVEPDVIRQAGNLLYVLNQYRGLAIVNLDTRQVLSQTATVGYPRDLYLVNGRAYVLVSYAQDISYESGMLSVSYTSKLYVLNVENPSDVREEGAFAFEGDLVDSRMVGSVIYAVCSDYTGYGYDSGDSIVTMEKAQKSYGSTWAVSLNISEPANVVIADTLSFSGYGNLIQATNFAIFSVSTNWNYNTNTATSVVNYIDISDPAGKIALRGAAEIPGYMSDRFKMDAWNDALRVVTNTGWPTRQTYVTTLDISNPDTIAQLGQTALENASGETVYATRFDGPLAYIVTYLTVDPLFVVDLSDPTTPQIKGELKIPGWSTHIEPRGDRLIALGVDDADGNRKVMVSLFDVSAPENPQRIAYESFGDNWAWSSAYGDVKAFTVLDDMLLVPFSGWTDSFGGYDRLQFVSWSRNSLATRGYVDLQGSAVRSFAYGANYYSVTQEQLAVIDATNLDSPFVSDSITLAENVVDALPLQDGWVAEIISRNERGDAIVRASQPQTGALGNELVLPVMNILNVFSWNGSIVITGGVYQSEPEYNAFCLVYLVDFSTPEQPTILREWTVPIEPWWGGWWYYPAMEDAVAVRPAKALKQYWWGYVNSDESVILTGDYLILRGTAKNYDLIFGKEQPWQGMAVVDLAGVDPIYLAGLGYKDIARMTCSEGIVYVTTRLNAGRDNASRSICAYYLQEFNPATREMSDGINVPGLLLGRTSTANYMLFEDYQYTSDWQASTMLHNAEMKNGKIKILDSVTFDSGYWNLKIDDNTVWFGGQKYNYTENTTDSGNGSASVVSSNMPYYNNLYALGYHRLNDTGKFATKKEFNIGNAWCTMLGVKGESSFVAIESAAIARCDFEMSPPAIDSIVPIMGYAQKIRFGSDSAYVSLGYGGLGILPL